MDRSASSHIPSVQHALRNKLSIITGSIDILRMGETLSTEGIEDLDRMRRACDGALALIDGLAPEDPTQ